MFELNLIDKAALILTLIGALNWAFIGFMNCDIIKVIFGFTPIIQRIIYILIGTSAIYVLVFILKISYDYKKK